MLPNVTQRPRASLGRVLDDLGDTLLELVHGDPENPAEIDGVVIHDPVDEPHYPPHALVLGVAVTDADVVALTRDLGRRGVVGLVVRAPVALTPEIRTAVDESGVALLGLRRGATWAQLSSLLRSLLAEDDIGVGEPESLGGLPAGDLFAVANAVAALLDAPITIEDRSSRVLAFSGRQDEADASRIETIIGRQVPERYARTLTEHGVFRDLYREDKPVVVDPQEFAFDDITKQRVAIAVRAGDQVLGSIWAVMDGEVTGERTAALQDAAKLVALHLLRVRAGADVRRRLRTDLVGTALEGGAGAQDALRRLGLAGRHVVVLAAALRDERGGRGEQDRAAELERLADAFAVHLTSAVPAAAIAAVSGVVWALVPVLPPGEDPEERAVRIATDFCERVGFALPTVVAVGGVAGDVSGVTRARVTANRVLRVLGDGHVTLRVARLEDVQTQALLLELRDLAATRGEGPVGPIALLLEHDEQGAGGLVETLEAWLDAFGDVTAAGGGALHPPQHPALPPTADHRAERTRPGRPRAALRGDAAAADPRPALTQAGACRSPGLRRRLGGRRDRRAGRARGRRRRRRRRRAAGDMPRSALTGMRVSPA